MGETRGRASGGGGGGGVRYSKSDSGEGEGASCEEDLLVVGRASKSMTEANIPRYRSLASLLIIYKSNPFENQYLYTNVVT